VGSKVEARYKGKSKYYPGVITRIRLNGTFDIDYDDGEKETGVDRVLIQLVASDTSNDANRFEVGSNVLVRLDGKSKYYPAIISSRRFDGDAFDVELDDGSLRKSIPIANIKPCDQSHRQRLITLGKAISDPKSTYAIGDRVACFWYRPTTFSAPRVMEIPKAVRIIQFHSDGCYTVEFELDGSFLDDVSEDHLQDWARANASVNNSISRQSNPQLGDWEPVLEMARALSRRGGERHSLPSPQKLLEEKSPMKRFELCFEKRTLDEFLSSFEIIDQDNQGELDEHQLLLCFRDLGADASLADIKHWAKSRGRAGKQLKLFDFTDMMLAYSKLFYAPQSDLDQEAAKASALARSLRLDGEWKDMSFFARSFGKKRLRALERAFDSFAVRNESTGDSRIQAKYILEAFHQVGKAVTVTRMTEWMTESDVRPHDGISLADFISVYAFFFGPSSTAQLGDGLDLGRDVRSGTRLSMSEIAVSVLQEERWRGSADQVDSFVRRISAGRSARTTECISKLRDNFESIDTEGLGYVPIDRVGDILRHASIPPSSYQYALQQYLSKSQYNKQSTAILPELFSQFGSIISESCESGVSIADSLAMFRLYHDSTTIRGAVDLTLRIIDNVLGHADDPKYWRININSDVSVVLFVFSS
jgi:Ca2+-binding EF-hand superfamily protein